MSCITIQDGTGKNYAAKVDSNNLLNTRAVTESAERWANKKLGQAFSLSFTQTPTGAGDCFFYFKNTSNKDVVFEGMHIYVAGNEAIEMYIQDAGTAAGGTTVVPVNLNTGFAKVLTATIEQGSNITGLSGGSLVSRYYVPANATTNSINYEQDIVVSAQQTLTLYAVTGGIVIDGFLDCNIAEEVE